jgi:hypothetical protein
MEHKGLHDAASDSGEEPGRMYRPPYRSVGGNR